MPGPSKVVVLDPDRRAGRQVQLGFEREGVVAVIGDASRPELGDPGLVVVGGVDGHALELLQRTRSLLDGADVPIVFAGRGVDRAAAVAAGADEVVQRPAYLRDIVTVGRLLCGVAASDRNRLQGSLAEVTGVYTLVRALSTLGRSAVLTLIRGLRRGEVRFYNGEITSAQVGLIHGQAAFHQLLLWTDARFDFHHEDLVRRAQIPLTSEELFADAERFLEGVRETAERLSPSMVLEQDMQRITSLGTTVPSEVYGVLRMFDGHRVLADILEDSPYRVFETLRVAQKALEAGLIRVAQGARPKATWRAVLAIEEWLVGGETRDSVVERTSAVVDTEPVAKVASGASQSGQYSKFKKKKKKKKAEPAASASQPIPQQRADIDWGALVPRTVGAEVGPLSGVVPAVGAHGEIDIATRGVSREGLEALMDTDKRQRIFPTDIGLEPSVVLGDTNPELDAAAIAKADAEAAAKAAADAKAKADAEAAAKAAADAKAKADAEAADPAVVQQRVRDSAQQLIRDTLERQRREAAEAAERLAAERAVAAMVAHPTPAASPVATMVAQPVSEPMPVASDDVPTLPVIKIEPIAVAPHQTIDGGGSPSAGSAAESPRAIIDEPSDGVVREVSGADTAKLAARSRRPSPAPLESDGPPIKETTGEIRPRLPTAEPQREPIAEPSILVADLAAVHEAVSAIASAQAAAPATVDAATPAREQAVAAVRKDAASFSDDEEAFFRAGTTSPGAGHTAPVVRQESFDDLDEGYQPPKFWDRVFGRTKRNSTSYIPQPKQPKKPSGPSK